MKNVHVIGNIPQKIKKRAVLDAVDESGVSSLIQALSQDPEFQAKFFEEMVLSDNPVTDLAIDLAYTRITKND